MQPDPNETVQLPVPAPFMWACRECTQWLLRLARQWTSPDGCFWEQLQVARHIAEAHPEDVPTQHLDECALCPEYARRRDNDVALVWAQHRARDLFMPSSIARML